jgi:hypothetical protein
MRPFLVAAAALGVVMAPGVAHADTYPTDHATPAPAVAPKPADYPYPEFSVCYPLTQVSPTLGRRDCFLYVSKTGALVPGSRVSAVFPQNNPLVAPTFEPVAPITAAPVHEAPATRPATPVRNVGSSPASTPVTAPTSQPAPQQASQPAETPAAPTTAAPVVADPGAEASTPASQSHGWPVSAWVALVAAIVLVGTLVYRPRKR